MTLLVVKDVRGIVLMDRYFQKILKDYISKQKQNNLSTFSNKKLSIKTNLEIYNFISTSLPGNGGGGGAYFLNQFLFIITGPNGGGGGSRSSLYNRFIPNFRRYIQAKK